MFICICWWVCLSNTVLFSPQGSTGLGIMIIEGKHAEYGQGIFISDLQEGSVAAEVRTDNFLNILFAWY